MGKGFSLTDATQLVYIQWEGGCSYGKQHVGRNGIFICITYNIFTYILFITTAHIETTSDTDKNLTKVENCDKCLVYLELEGLKATVFWEMW
jgi:hypothetical protein